METQVDSKADFLALSRYQSHKQIPDEIRNQLENDIRNLSRTQLRHKYKSEYNSWRNAKQRCRNGKGKFSEEWVEFPAFLWSEGPAPEGQTSLDRIDNGNFDYGPGLCRWASPSVQNSNKSDNVYIEYDGRIENVAYWSMQTGIALSTLYQRKKSGWSDREVIEGKGTKNRSSSNRPWPEDNHEVWERQFLLRVMREPMSPLKFLSETAMAALERLRDFSATVPPDPETGRHPDNIADYIDKATNLWIARYELAQTHMDYKRWESKLKRLSASGEAGISMKEFHQLNPPPDITAFHRLTGDLPKDRPAAFKEVYPPR